MQNLEKVIFIVRIVISEYVYRMYTEWIQVKKKLWKYIF